MIDNFPKVYFDTPNFDVHDIGALFEVFVYEFFGLISTMFKLLDSIQINGVGLFSILITFFILGIIIPIIFTIVRARSIGYQREVGRERRKLERKLDNQNGKKG